jgi:hypothetical protein
MSDVRGCLYARSAYIVFACQETNDKIDSERNQKEIELREEDFHRRLFLHLEVMQHSEFET